MQAPPGPSVDRADLPARLAGINFTFNRAFQLAVRAKWGFVPPEHESPYEYDQGDTLVVDYDDLYNLAEVAIVALKAADALVDERDRLLRELRAFVASCAEAHDQVPDDAWNTMDAAVDRLRTFAGETEPAQ